MDPISNLTSTLASAASSSASSAAATAGGSSAKAPLTATQKAALVQLHKAATQLEGVFVGMMLKEMRSSVPDSSLFGNSMTESTFTEMLDQQRAQSMANSGSLGIGKILENQLKQSVLGDAATESKVNIPTQGELL
jgi:Rod binding domain-containing protein